ncbi:unnamed protein product [Trichogramma brassicae]|uniref:Uncharacterized protein n=1 Tax=Trichogramma brassicae TaxID=86971 RepID=A0A6H5HZY2_9HYME|nr:unnamed protein product [Trichogramma brassicae]
MEMPADTADGAPNVSTNSNSSSNSSSNNTAARAKSPPRSTKRKPKPKSKSQQRCGRCRRRSQRNGAAGVSSPGRAGGTGESLGLAQERPQGAIPAPLPHLQQELQGHVQRQRPREDPHPARSPSAAAPAASASGRRLIWRSTMRRTWCRRTAAVASRPTELDRHVVSSSSSSSSSNSNSRISSHSSSNGNSRSKPATPSSTRRPSTPSPRPIQNFSTSLPRCNEQYSVLASVKVIFQNIQKAVNVNVHLSPELRRPDAAPSIARDNAKNTGQDPMPSVRTRPRAGDLRQYHPTTPENIKIEDEKIVIFIPDRSFHVSFSNFASTSSHLIASHTVKFAPEFWIIKSQKYDAAMTSISGRKKSENQTCLASLVPCVLNKTIYKSRKHPTVLRMPIRAPQRIVTAAISPITTLSPLPRGSCKYTCKTYTRSPASLPAFVNIAERRSPGTERWPPPASFPRKKGKIWEILPDHRKVRTFGQG